MADKAANKPTKRKRQTKESKQTPSSPSHEDKEMEETKADFDVPVSATPSAVPEPVQVAAAAANGSSAAAAVANGSANHAPVTAANGDSDHASANGSVDGDAGPSAASDDAPTYDVEPAPAPEVDDSDEKSRVEINRKIMSTRAFASLDKLYFRLYKAENGQKKNKMCASIALKGSAGAFVIHTPCFQVLKAALYPVANSESEKWTSFKPTDKRNLLPPMFWVKQSVMCRVNMKSEDPATKKFIAAIRKPLFEEFAEFCVKTEPEDAKRFLGIKKEMYARLREKTVSEREYLIQAFKDEHLTDPFRKPKDETGGAPDADASDHWTVSFTADNYTPRYEPGPNPTKEESKKAFEKDMKKIRDEFPERYSLIMNTPKLRMLAETWGVCANPIRIVNAKGALMWNAEEIANGNGFPVVSPGRLCSFYVVPKVVTEHNGTSRINLELKTIVMYMDSEPVGRTAIEDLGLGDEFVTPVDGVAREQLKITEDERLRLNAPE